MNLEGGTIIKAGGINALFDRVTVKLFEESIVSEMLRVFFLIGHYH